MGLTQIALPSALPTKVNGGGLVGPVCLITPPSVFLMDERVFMNLGILRVAAVLEQAGVKVEVLDLSGISNFTDAVEDHCRFSSAVHFGLTATTPQLPAAAKVAKVIRSVRPDARIILGGPHITLVNAALKRERREGRLGRASHAFEQLEKMFDVLVAGDGEEAIFHACQSNTPKLVDADDPKSPLWITGSKLTNLPFPARHLVDHQSYHYSIDGRRAYSLIAQLGCPFECGFCGGRESPMLRRVRMRTSESIVAEMLHMSETLGCSGFMFYDDELNVNPKMLELMSLIVRTQKERGLEWCLRGFIKAELFTEAQAAAMYEAGFRWILTGFESGSPEILKAINKKATRGDNTQCVEIAHKHGLKVKALMSIGHPGETEQTVLETRRWLLEVKPDDFDLTIITCYPGTPYYDQAVPTDEKGIWVYSFPKTGAKLFQYEIDYSAIANYYKGDPDGGYQAYVFTESLTPADLVSLRDHVERDVRAELCIPFNKGVPASLYEHSMGQIGPLPPNILRVSARTPAAR